MYGAQGYCFMISLRRYLRDGYHESGGKQRAEGDTCNVLLGTKLLRGTMRKKLLMILGNWNLEKSIQIQKPNLPGQIPLTWMKVSWEIVYHFWQKSDLFGFSVYTAIYLGFLLFFYHPLVINLLRDFVLFLYLASQLKFSSFPFLGMFFASLPVAFICYHDWLFFALTTALFVCILSAVSSSFSISSHLSGTEGLPDLFFFFPCTKQCY